MKLQAQSCLVFLALTGTLFLSSSATVCDHQCLFGFYCAQGLTCSNGICSGTACDDSATAPQVTLPEGEAFAFDGEAGKVYNFITEQEHQLNAKFVEGSAVGGALVESMGLKLHDNQVEIATDDHGEMQVKIDGNPVDLNQENSFQAAHQTDKVNVTVHKYREHLGNTVHLITNLYNLLVVATPGQWNEDLKDTVRGHLNMVLAVEPSEYAAREVDGVMGGISLQNAYTSDVQGPPREEYQVSHLFADNFKHNLFGLASTSKPAAAEVQEARRSLLPTTRRRLGEAQVAEPVWVSLPRL